MGYYGNGCLIIIHSHLRKGFEGGVVLLIKIIKGLGGGVNLYNLGWCCGNLKNLKRVSHLLQTLKIFGVSRLLSLKG